MTIGEMRDWLDQFDEEMDNVEIGIAFQPTYPLEYELREPRWNGEGDTADGKVWLCAVNQRGYLPQEVCDAIGWR